MPLQFVNRRPPTPFDINQLHLVVGLSLQRPRFEVLELGYELCLLAVVAFEGRLNPRFPPTILASLTTSQVLRRPPEVT